MLNKLTESSRSTMLYCFSPAIMIATFSIEWALAVYVLAAYGRHRIGQLATALLVFLGLFQLAEYQICRGSDTAIWTILGLLGITILPPLGLHIISATTKRQGVTWAGYLLALFFALVFIILPEAVQGATCTGNYVILHLESKVSFAYGMYYLGFVFLGTWEAYHAHLVAKKAAIRQRLYWMTVGYLAFLVPMSIAYLLIPATRAAVPSIMCGFAVILAIILAWKVVPTADVSE